MYEVEQKYRVADPAALRHRLEQLGARFEPPIEQRDLYLAHPSRSFRETDEAFRIRREGSCVAITYKGPKIDKSTKTRREIEIPLAAGDHDPKTLYEQAKAMFAALGFAPVFEVVKHRANGTIDWQGQALVLALDSVAGLGDFLEIETLATAEELPQKRDLLAAFALPLDLGQPEMRGYLDLLMRNGGV